MQKLDLRLGLIIFTSLFCAGSVAQNIGPSIKELNSNSSSNAAVDFYLPTDAIGLSPLSGKVVSMERIAGGYTLELELTVKNCSDQISPISFAENAGVVTISVWNIARKLSYVAPCASNPTFRQEILIRSPHPFVKTIFLGI